MEKTKNQDILIVDDSSTNLCILTLMLKRNGISSRTAVSGEEALTMARKQQPALVLLDIEMPGIDGFETCRRFKADDELEHIPILFISSFQEAGKKVQAFRAGGVDYINKPVQEEELVARIETQLQMKRLQEQMLLEIAEKKQLINILCHDVANPLSCISGWAELLSMDSKLKLDGKVANRVNRILQASNQAADVITHAREMERLSGHEKELFFEPIKVTDIVTSTLAVFKKQLLEKNIVFRCIPELPGLKISILAERISFSANVFNNIFSNAIKFSSPGSVITLFVDEKTGSDMVRLILEDEGIGIPQAHIQNIFNAGRTNSRAGTNGEKGSGFGLPLAKKYMEAYNGSISIKSRSKEEFPGRSGTTITLELKKAQRAPVSSAMLRPRYNDVLLQLSNTG